MSQVRVIAGRVLLIAALVAGGASYELLNRPQEQVHVLATPLDAALPFVPLFAVPYLLYLPFVLLTFVLLAVTSWKRFTTLAVAALITIAVADLFYLFFQTYVARPAVPGTDFASQLVRYVYASDQPYNDFPSLHTAGSTLCAIAYFRWRRLYGFLALPLVLAIIASTVLIRQHYLADVAGGLVLAGVSYWIAARLTALAARRAPSVPVHTPAKATISAPAAGDDPPSSP